MAASISVSPSGLFGWGLAALAQDRFKVFGWTGI